MVDNEPSILSMMTPLQAVIMERVKQDSKWGEQSHPDLEWYAILGEEFGEVGNALCVALVNPVDATMVDSALKNLECEIVQVVAVGMAWLENIRRLAAEAIDPSHDGYHFVVCPRCGGTRKETTAAQ